MLLFQKCIVPHETAVAKKHAITTRVRLSVTTCLYLKPSTRARSLSTLIAVDVKTDNPHKTKPVTMYPSLWKFILISRAITETAKSGCEIRPAKRSVTARDRNKSFVGGWREVSFWSATRIRALPRDAVMDRKMFKAEINTNTLVNNVDMRKRCPYVKVCPPPKVCLPCTPHLWSL